MYYSNHELLFVLLRTEDALFVKSSVLDSTLKPQYWRL